MIENTSYSNIFYSGLWVFDDLSPLNDILSSLEASIMASAKWVSAVQASSLKYLKIVLSKESFLFSIDYLFENIIERGYVDIYVVTLHGAQDWCW